MLRLDHNRALSQIAAKTGTKVGDIEKLTVWGNTRPPCTPTIASPPSTAKPPGT